MSHGETDTHETTDENDNDIDYNGINASQDSPDREYSNDFSSNERIRQRGLLVREGRFKKLIDLGMQLPLDVSCEIDTIKWAINVIKWDREMGVESMSHKVEQKGTPGLLTLTFEAAQQRVNKAQGVLHDLPNSLVDFLAHLRVMRLREPDDDGIHEPKLPKEEFILTELHSSLAASIVLFRSLEKAILGPTSSGIVTSMKSQIDAISSRKLSHTSADFLSAQSKLKDLQEQMLHVGTVDVNISIPGKDAAAEVKYEHAFKIRVGAPSKVSRQVAFLLSGQYKGKVRSVPVGGSSAGGQKSKGASSSSIHGEADDCSSEATDSGSDSSSDEDDGVDDIEAAELASRRGRSVGSAGELAAVAVEKLENRQLVRWQEGARVRIKEKRQYLQPPTETAHGC